MALLLISKGYKIFINLSKINKRKVSGLTSLHILKSLKFNWSSYVSLTIAVVIARLIYSISSSIIINYTAFIK